MPCAAEFAPALASLCRLPFVAYEADNDERVVRPDATGDALCRNPLLARAAGIVAAIEAAEYFAFEGDGGFEPFDAVVQMGAH